MSIKGSKAERYSVWDQPHENNSETHKEQVSAASIKETTKSAGSQRQDIKQKLK